MRRWRTSTADALRDRLLLIGGLLGTAHQTVIAQADRPWLLGLFAAMMGLPYAFAADRSGRPPEPPPPEPPAAPLPPSGAATAGPPATSPPAA